MTRSFRIIARSGYTARYPENTRPAFEAALAVGADAITCEVQFCADGEPVVLRDPTLDRTTGRPGVVGELDCQALQRVSAHEPDRFGARFAGTPVPTLAEIVQLLEPHPQVIAFVEVMRDTAPRHAIPQAVEQVLRTCRPLGERAVVISRDGAVVQEARSLGKGRVGWVLPGWSTMERDRLETIQPDFALVDQDLLPPPPTPLWEGPWEWAVYQVDDPQRAAEFADRGFGWIATGEIERIASARASRAG